MKKYLQNIFGLFIVFAICVCFFTPDTEVHASTKKGIEYTGSVGVAWVRNLDDSPLSIRESLWGNYCLEVDYLTQSTACSVYVGKTKWNTLKSLLEAVGTSLVCEGVGRLLVQAGVCSSVPTIATIAVSTIVGFGYSLLAKLEIQGFEKALEGMKPGQMLRVKYLMTNNLLTKCYSKYTPQKTTIRKYARNTYSIETPFSGTYGDWKKNKYGYLYKL